MTPDELFAGNIKIAEKLWRYYRQWSPNPDDLRQDAYLALVRACQTYNPRLGWKFSTYAYAIIQRHMQRCLRIGSSMVRSPVGPKQYENQWWPQDFDYVDPNDNNLNGDKHGTNRSIPQYFPSTDPKVVERLSDLGEIEALLKTLSSRQRIVIVNRYGLGGVEPKTLDEIAPLVGVTTREAVRQLECRAIKRLKREAPYVRP